MPTVNDHARANRWDFGARDAGDKKDAEEFCWMRKDKVNNPQNSLAEESLRADFIPCTDRIIATSRLWRILTKPRAQSTEFLHLVHSYSVISQNSGSLQYKVRVSFATEFNDG
jgi:hypothetical protein